ncbi:MAG: hypothetical protein KDD51_02235 [Bdellovibrionales bacterium]|nr:hypothetical protein [Bdellovibrionales bacterium]
MGTSLKWLLFGILGVILLGCDRQIHTPLKGDPGVPIREIVGSKYCKPAGEGEYASLEGVVDSKGFDGSHYYAEGGGCIERPLLDTWAVTHNGDALKWSEASIKSPMVRTPTEEVLFLFTTHYEAGSLIKPNWKINWYHTIANGTFEAPERILIVYKKEWGTSFISHWEGNITLERLDENVTAFSMYNSISGTRIDEKNAVGGVHDLLDNFRRHKPNWEYLQEQK